ncbi:hypothetical protein DSO57_1028259 [Entomophthora muscae]|uniref:Uncharacterized protein n=1 Tax=Entomophthora muscae TaxID=34485 RepID=A0ACC2UM41_9FUNG|nr:hypothetical protein DSO57_1028259 [Entomophthora muscae]
MSSGIMAIWTKGSRPESIDRRLLREEVDILEQMERSVETEDMAGRVRYEGVKTEEVQEADGSPLEEHISGLGVHHLSIHQTTDRRSLLLLVLPSIRHPCCSRPVLIPW